MKKLTLKSKIIIALLAIVLIAGISIILTIGFNKDLEYEDAQNIQLYINSDFEVSDIKQITDEIFQNQEVMIQKVEVYKDSVSITTKEITDDQKSQLVSKINEKYSRDIDEKNTDIKVVPHIKLMDLITPYIIPFIIATVIILIYLVIRYRKLGVLKVILKTVGIIILTELELISLIAITRIPLGRLTIPMVITVYMLSLIGITTKYEKQLSSKIKEEKKEEEK